MFFLIKVRDLKSFVQNVIFVSPSMKITNLFIKIKFARPHSAVLREEYAETDGLISMIDVTEKLVPNVNSGNKLLNAQSSSYLKISLRCQQEFFYKI